VPSKSLFHHPQEQLLQKIIRVSEVAPNQKNGKQKQHFQNCMPSNHFRGQATNRFVQVLKDLFF
jgi:hypothetical protein